MLFRGIRCMQPTSTGNCLIMLWVCKDDQISTHAHMHMHTQCCQLFIIHTHSHMHVHILDKHVGLHALYVDVHSDDVLQHV